MKLNKLLILIICALILSGCTTKEVQKNSPKKETIIENKQEEIVYSDKNMAPIGIYTLKGNTLTRLHKFNTQLVVEKDINTFQIFPSNEEKVTLTSAFGPSFHNEWIKYPNIKQGFNIKFTLNTGEEISYNILNPSQTFDKWEYLMNYLYDDYANYGKSFYSHLESANENTLYTSFKMQASYYSKSITSKIELTAFTYDSEDDFLNGEYRGKSKHKIDICLEGYEC